MEEREVSLLLPFSFHRISPEIFAIPDVTVSNPRLVQEFSINISLIYLQLTVVQLRSINSAMSSIGVTSTGSNGLEEQLLYRALSASLEMLKGFAGIESGSFTHAPGELFISS
jgi:hypothetical protein